jgi:hypothetical protein
VTAAAPALAAELEGGLRRLQLAYFRRIAAETLQTPVALRDLLSDLEGGESPRH